MTRINVGVEPRELCDQHLVAEYRELPRLWSYRPKGRAPADFKLGSGHVLWCAQFPGMLVDRFVAIVDEMRARNIVVNFPLPPTGIGDARPPREAIERARPIVQARIRERLSTMKRPPRWRGHKPPSWAVGDRAVACDLVGVQCES